MELKSSLNSQFSDHITNGIIDVTYFVSKDESDKLTCIYSSNNSYKSGSKHIFYKISPLVRVLALGENIISSEVENELSSEEEDIQLCYLHEWGPMNKIVFLYTFNSSFQNIKTIISNTFHDKNILINHFINQLYGRSYEK